MKRTEDKKLALFNIDKENLKQFKILAINSDISMMEIVNDLILTAIENKVYILKYNNKIKVLI